MPGGHDAGTCAAAGTVRARVTASAHAAKAFPRGRRSHGADFTAGCTLERARVLPEDRRTNTLVNASSPTREAAGEWTRRRLAL